MAPLQLETLLLGKVGHSLITCLSILIAEIEASRILVIGIEIPNEVKEKAKVVDKK